MKKNKNSALLHLAVKINSSEVLLAFSIVVGVQVVYYLFFFSRLAEDPISTIDEIRNTIHEEEAFPPVSVVICAHDEVKTLHRNLPSILEQKYPKYEVIVVNDNSEDDSEMMLMRLEAKYSHLVVRHIHSQSKTLRGKKYPLTIGIRAASFDHILLTDADCTPTSDHWISNMASAFNRKKEIVLGYAPYKKNPGLLNKFIRYETFLSAMQYLSYALAGVPYMGVGRNLAYHRHIFFDHNIYPKYPQLLSGDDDLLINAAANSQNTAIQIGKSSFMFSEPKRTWDEYWHQKGRHISSSRYYRLCHKVLLSLFSLSNFFFYMLMVITLLYTPFRVEALILFSLRIIIQGMVYRTAMKKLGEQDLIWLFPLMDMLFLLYYVKLIPKIINQKTGTWK